MRLILGILIQVISLSLYSWPGDQASLACLQTKPNREDIEDQFFSRNAYATNGKTKEENQQIAIERVKTIIHNNHDMDYRVTKLGDSLSDLVDFYGLAIPRNIFPNYGDAAGTFGRIPVFMDSWTDYMTAGARIANGKQIFLEGAFPPYALNVLRPRNHVYLFYEGRGKFKLYSNGQTLLGLYDSKTLRNYTIDLLEGK